MRAALEQRYADAIAPLRCGLRPRPSRRHHPRRLSRCASRDVRAAPAQRARLVRDSRLHRPPRRPRRPAMTAHSPSKPSGGPGRPIPTVALRGSST
jgi:hypothetical protein